MTDERNRPIARALHHALIDDARCGQVTGLARRLGLSASTLYGYAEGDSTVPCWLAEAIFELTHDRALYDSMTGATRCGLLFSAPPAPARDPIEQVATAALRVGGAAGRLQADTADALADGLVTGKEGA